MVPFQNNILIFYIFAHRATQNVLLKFRDIVWNGTKYKFWFWKKVKEKTLKYKLLDNTKLFEFKALSQYCMQNSVCCLR